VNELPPQFISKQKTAVAVPMNSLSEVRNKAVEEVEKKYFLFLLTKHKGNITRISEEAGMTRRHIHRILKKHDLDPHLYRHP
jgi:transcriptional regulator of acetoin/glycerol metabolism